MSPGQNTKSMKRKNICPRATQENSRRKLTYSKMGSARLNKDYGPNSLKFLTRGRWNLRKTSESLWNNVTPKNHKGSGGRICRVPGNTDTSIKVKNLIHQTLPMAPSWTSWFYTWKILNIRQIIKKCRVIQYTGGPEKARSTHLLIWREMNTRFYHLVTMKLVMGYTRHFLFRFVYFTMSAVLC